MKIPNEAPFLGYAAECEEEKLQMKMILDPENPDPYGYGPHWEELGEEEEE